MNNDKRQNRLVISFSGGRSSAVMLDRCIKRYGDTHEILITFANTGCEHEETLKFVDETDKHFCIPRGHKVVWIEAEIHGPGKGPTAKLVDFDSASRNGEPFEAAIKKHGVFCKSHPNCTGRLKTEPMEQYIRQQFGWKRNSYYTAIGIRADEADRMSAKRHELGYIYPLVDEGWRKRDVNNFMRKFDWDLKLDHDAWGNCTWCWKKSLRKLMTIAKEDPSVMDFPARMEARYGHINKGKGKLDKPRTFFRENRSAKDILHLAKTEDFEPYEDDKFDQMELFNEILDVGSACGDSCEIGTDEE